MAKGLRLSGDNELAALQQSMRSRMREDEARHRTTDGGVEGHAADTYRPTGVPAQSGMEPDGVCQIGGKESRPRVSRDPRATYAAGIKPGPSTQFAPSEPRSVAGHSDCPINGAKADSSTQPTVSPRESRSGAIGERATAASSSTITIPWPPTGNSSVRHGNGSHYLRKEVLDYRRQVAELCIGAKRMTGPYRLKVAFSPPDKRQRDMDNALKSLLDALVLAGFLPSDSMTYMRELYACVVDKRAGIVQVTAEAV